MAVLGMDPEKEIFSLFALCDSQIDENPWVCFELRYPVSEDTL